MFCMHCGAELPDEAKFCFSCGASIDGAKATTRSINRVQLRCKNCNGEMDVDEDRPILMCPFCGSQEIVLEGDKVTIQRIKSKAYKEVELGKQQTYRDVELGKKELELKGDNNIFKRILISFAIILVGAIIGYFSLRNASLGGLLVGVVMIVAGVISLQNTIGKKGQKRSGSVKSSALKTRTTQADVEIARIEADERKHKWEKISEIALIIVCLIMGGMSLIGMLLIGLW